MRTRCWCVTDYYITAAEEKPHPSIHVTASDTDCTIHRRVEELEEEREDSEVRGKIGQRKREGHSDFKESTACSKS